MDLDELLYNALRADAELMSAVGQRIRSTCFEVSPDDVDTTPLPCIIVTDEGFHSGTSTKDATWEPAEDSVQASVEVDAASPREVKTLLRRVRTAVAAYVAALEENGEDIPYLQSMQSSPLSWDWIKPCYHQSISYQCLVPNT